MNRIVEQSKIAKGSFYQYFEDKKDLYFYLIDTIYKKKIQYLGPILQSSGERSFSDNIKKLLLSGLSFSLNDPRLQRMAVDFTTNHRKLVDEFSAKYNPEAIDIYMALLSQAREKGELRGDVNIQSASFFISAIVNQTSILMMGRLDKLLPDDDLVRELLTFINYAVLDHRSESLLS